MAYNYETGVVGQLDSLQSLKASGNTPGDKFKLFLFDIILHNDEEVAFLPLSIRKEHLESFKSTKWIEVIQSRVFKGERSVIWQASAKGYRPPEERKLKIIAFNDYDYNSKLQEITDMFNSAKQRGHEGLVIKDDSGIYSFGTVAGWFKLKSLHPDHVETLDLIVMGGDFSEVI